MQHDPKQTAILNYLSLYAAPCAAWMDDDSDASAMAADPAPQKPAGPDTP